MIYNPLVSIVVLTYNSQKHIRQTLDSIIQQKTTFPVEIIISDDGSDDQTIDILSEYQGLYDTVKVFHNEKNSGIIVNYKKALDQCSGKYFAFCGHDDYWHDQLKLQDQVEFLENNPEFGLVHTDYDFLDEVTGNVIKRTNSLNRIKINQGDISDELIAEYFIGSCTPCYRKVVFDKYVPLDDFIRLQIPFEDVPVNISISLHSKIGYIDRSMATFRYGHKSASNPADIAKCEQYIDGHKRMIDYFYEKFPEKFNSRRNNFPIFKSTRMLIYAYELNDFEKAGFYALKLKKMAQKSIQIYCANNVILFRLYLLSRSSSFLYRIYLQWYCMKSRHKKQGSQLIPVSS